MSHCSNCLCPAPIPPSSAKQRAVAMASNNYSHLTLIERVDLMYKVAYTDADGFRYGTRTTFHGVDPCKPDVGQYPHKSVKDKLRFIAIHTFRNKFPRLYKAYRILTQQGI